MAGIEIAAVLTSVLALAAFGTLIWQICNASDRYWLLAMGLFALPLSMLTFYGIRIPFDHWLVERLGADSYVLIGFRLWYAPLSEELAKLFPLLMAWPLFRRPLTEKNLVPVALTLGLGFAVGEMWVVAQDALRNPKLADLPFYQFGGFLNERLETCVSHPGFTVLAIWGLQKGGFRVVVGLLAAMTFHFVSNFPIFLMRFDFGKLGEPTWQVLLQIWLFLCVIASAVLLGVMSAGAKRIFQLVTSAKVKCPECGEVYRQPILGGNFGVWRYEPCGACRKWHWVSLKDLQ